MRAGPWARATLPDGQRLDVVVLSRTRTGDGRWWYECEAILPGRHQHADGATEPTGAPTAISVAADDITPIPGEDYAAVPTSGAVAGRQWVLARLRRHLDEGPAWCLHRRGCWQARGDLRRVSTREAAAALAGAAARAEPCDVCRPDRALPR